MRPSKDKYPVGYETWIEEPVGEYYEGHEEVADVRLRVPFASPAGLKIAMHAMAAVAQGYLALEYWKWYDEDEESDDEVIRVRKRVVRKVVPRVPEMPAYVPRVAESVGTVQWSYDADPAKAVKAARRQGMSWTANGEGRAAMMMLVAAVEDSSLGESRAMPVLDAPEHAGKVAYSMPLDEDSVAVKSAGGGNILLVTREVHDSFMSGRALSGDEFVSVLKDMGSVRVIQRFAKSTVFDNWSPAWRCLFETYGSVPTLDAVKTAALHSLAIRLLGCLYDRFKAEVVAVALSSHLYADRLRGFFQSKPSVSKFVSAVRKGKLPIAQSDAFVMRVFEIKDCYDAAVLGIEQVGLFAPALVTDAQNKLPIRDRYKKMPVVDEDVVVQPRHVHMRNLSTDKLWR